MPELQITSDGKLIIDGTRISGIVGQMTITTATIYEKSQGQEESGSQSSFTGFEDAKISVPLTMFETDKYSAVSKLNGVFKKLENGIPVIYTPNFQLAKALNIEHITIDDIKYSDSSTEGAITAEITLSEVDPPVSKVQPQSQAKDTTTEKKESPPIEEAVVTNEDKLLLNKGARYGL